MKTRFPLLLMAALAVASGCATKVRSISNSAYEARLYQGATAYNRELRETDVLGINPAEAVSEEAIQRALNVAGSVSLRSGGTILLIQSGAEHPDPALVQGLSRRFNVVPFTGLAPVRETERREIRWTPHGCKTCTTITEPALDTTSAYSRLLRLAAARAGAETVVCCWGILESAESNNVGKPVAWVPVMNWVLPDKREHMRIRLKVALVGVRTGNWTVFSPEAFKGGASTTRWTRESRDQKLVEALKAKAYAACVQELASGRFSVAIR